MASLTEFITSKRKLKVNQAKSAVARPWQRKFLGFSFTLHREPQRRIAPKAMLRFKERIRERRTRGVSMEKVAEERGRYLRGWQGYFGFCQTPYVLRNLDYWTRRRLRSFLWKQWKRGSVRFAELTQRGVDAELAAQTAGSAHSPWRLAESPGLHTNPGPSHGFCPQLLKPKDWGGVWKSMKPREFGLHWPIFL